MNFKIDQVIDVTESDYLELADCHVSVGEYDKAQALYDRVSEVDPDNPGPYIGMGNIALESGDLQNAKAAFSIASKLDPRCAKAYAGLALVAQQNGDLETSFDCYLKALDIDQNDLASLLGLFQTSCQMGTFAKVIYYLEVYLGIHPDDVAVMFCLASLYVREARLFDAKNILLNVIAVKPSHDDAIELLEEVENMIQQRKGKVA